ncbi:Nucleotidyl transferase [Anaeromyxobacter dehalogenans 2CP-1]|uniref:Nucleotidyl transferase n=1 Tax=Anaeromyxobacter dehalogenans (strain ATCC BAA-258 / DSM 21875 / 2CP-1) TaxID=455488 RepID=B8J7H7_ANAD2|nr:nucleotidyltransferase family protein [Anaeromyxobacter dehalogenans]ACL67157.1 Nucleotidyl transferase [Anaeromyxobacter dehalogenans 2CP-1]
MGDLAGMVLCAGLGTRLRPLTAHVPKPAVPVCGVPLVRCSLALLAGAGVRRAVVNVHHLPDLMAAEAEAAARALGLSLTVSREPVIAGTGGALREARAALRGADEILLVNGDVLFDVDLGAALATHRASGALATLVLLPMPAGARYAAVEVDAGGAVRRIAARFGPGGEGLRPWHFSGVHVLSAALLDAVPAEPFEADVNRHVYPPLMASGAIRGHVAAGYWNDLGTPERYLEANRDLLAGRVPLARFAGADPFTGAVEQLPGVRIAPGARVDPGARLAGPALVCAGAEVAAGAEIGPGAVVGPGCRVPAGAAVRRAVLWAGTALAPGERVEDAIAAGPDRVRGG